MTISDDSDMGIPWFSRKAPSLVDLCVTLAIDNIRYLGDVGETDLHLLERILPHCTKDQLMHIEESTTGRDLSLVTDELWMKFYKKDFGEKSLNLVIERMSKKKIAFRWKQLYEAKSKDVLEAETVAVNCLKQLYQKADAQKQSRKIQIGEKVPLPPSSNRRSWGNGYGYSIPSGKGSLMKKAKIDLLRSQEFKNLAAIRKNAVQRTHRLLGANSGFAPLPRSLTKNTTEVALAARKAILKKNLVKAIKRSNGSEGNNNITECML